MGTLINGILIEIRMSDVVERDNSDRSQTCRPIQYLAIDEAGRVRAKKAYDKANQQNSIDFINHLLKQVTTPIHIIRTDRSLVFQREFADHLEKLGIRYEHTDPSTLLKI